MVISWSLVVLVKVAGVEGRGISINFCNACYCWAVDCLGGVWMVENYRPLSPAIRPL